MSHTTLRLTDGYPEKSPYLSSEVKALQRDLQRWGFHVSLDGKFGPSTLVAVQSFQRKQGLRDDGVVGPKTWQLLASPQAANIGTGFSVAVAPPSTHVGGNGASHYFPLARVFSESWSHGAGAFGANRRARAHAGCDLYAPLGSWIHAIANGKVIKGPYAFYASTFALEIDHGGFIARYGEIQRNTSAHEGDSVKAGQRIARVGHLVGITVPSDMLHLELYQGTATGPLTVRGAESATRKDGHPYQRRSDLMDPTPLVNQWKNNLPDDRQPSA